MKSLNLDGDWVLVRGGEVLCPAIVPGSDQFFNLDKGCRKTLIAKPMRPMTQEELGERIPIRSLHHLNLN